MCEYSNGNYFSRLFSYSLLLLKDVDFRCRCSLSVGQTVSHISTFRISVSPVQLQWLDPRGQKLNGPEGKGRLPSPFTFCLSGLNEPLPLFGLPACPAGGSYLPLQSISKKEIKKAKQTFSMSEEGLKLRKKKELHARLDKQLSSSPYGNVFTLSSSFTNNKILPISSFFSY